MSEGGTKYDEGKKRWDLIPWDPGMEYVADVYTRGAAKYGDENWKAGIKYSRLFAALIRHLFAYWLRREQFDKENGQHHLASVIFYCLAFMYFDANATHNDDRRPHGTDSV
jgi:hypothetical protein